MKEPKLSEDFQLKACPKVLEFKDWAKYFKRPEDKEEALSFAQCSFRRAGNGIECENCDLFYNKPIRTNNEKKYLVELTKFVDDCKKYDIAYAKYQKELDKIQSENGYYI